MSITNWFLGYWLFRHVLGIHICHIHMVSIHQEGYGVLQSRGTRMPLFCKYFRTSHQYLIGAIRVHFHGLSVWSQGLAPVPQKPSTVLFPGFILFPVIHTLSIMASVITCRTLDAGHPTLYYEFPQAISLSIVNSSEWIG